MLGMACCAPFFTLFLIMILLSSISKRFEFEADRYASDSISAFESMLRKVESVFSRKRVLILKLLYGYIPVEERIKAAEKLSRPD